MHSFITLVTRAVTFILVVSLTTFPVSAIGGTDTLKLRDDVTLEAIRDHQAAFQAIADDNGGTRRTGTTGADESAAYVTEQLEAAGYAVEVQEFDFPYFEELSIPEFEQIAPVPTVYPHLDPAGFITMSFSGSGDVTALVQGVDIIIPPGGSANTSTSGCDVSDFAGFIPGGIALIQRGSCSFQAKVFNAANAGAVGVIIFNEGQPGRTDAFAGTLGSPTADIPVVGSSYAIGESLYTASLGTDVTVRLDVETISEVRTAYNVLADLPGKYDRVVMAGAHLDSVSAGPGINDNGSGAAALLEIALQMADVKPKLHNTLRFAWWGAEESGLVGSIDYVTGLSMDELKKLNAYLEFEMLGSPNFVRFVYDGDGSAFPPAGPEGSAVIEQLFEDYFADQGLPIEPTPLDGRHSYLAFYSSGIPVGGLFGGDLGIKTPAQAAVYGGSAGDQYDPCYHLACDTFDNVSLQALDDMSDAAAHAIQTLAMGSTSTPAKGSGRLTCEDLGYDFSIKAEPDGCRQSSGFWKSNPGAWPVESIEIGGVVYPKADAIDIMTAKAKGDKTYSLFIETVAAKLNDMTCGPYPDIAPVIADADAWLALYPPGSGIKSKDSEWDEGGALNAALSAFNGGSFMSGSWSLDGIATVDIETADGIYFDWTSTRSADAVIVKGGRDVNLYEYDPESFGDIGLHAPINSKTGTPYGLSYVEFCFDWDIDISVRKFNDQNDNGVWDDGEPEIGVDQFINPDGTIGGTGGWPYLFSFPMDTGFIDLFETPGMHQYSYAGVYTIAEQEFLLWDPTALIINDVPQPVSTEANITYDGEADEFVEVVFGNVGYTEILGRKFEDLNGNGVHDAGEPGVENVTVTLTGTDILGDPVDLSTATGPGGEFAFQNLVPGTYTVTETAWPSALWVPSTATVSGPHVLDSGDSLDLGWVFGNVLPGSIHGHKFVDVNGNGVEDDGEPGLPDVIIELTGDTDGDGDIDQVFVPTNEAGEYWFLGLWPGDYTVAEIVPDGWTPTTPIEVEVTVISGVELVARAGQAMLTDEQIAAAYEEVVDESLAFGNFQYGSIHGYKFHDLDADGVWDPGEPGLAGWAIELIVGDDDVIAVTVTDANGEYEFLDLGPGTYEVAEVLQPEWVPSTASPPPLTLQSGQEYVAEDGQSGIGGVPGKFETTEPLLAFGNFQFGSIHGYKFDDLNGNGVDDGEPRLSGVQIDLHINGSVEQTTVTDANGEYGFLELLPNAYYVTEVPPEGWVQSTPNPPTLTIMSGQEYVAEDGLANLPPGSTKVEILVPGLAFGNYVPGSINGLKFEDLNANGIQDGDEPPIEGVVVTLTGTDGAGSVVNVDTATGPDGAFNFSNLVPGSYTVTETLPPGWQASTPISSGPHDLLSGQNLGLGWVFSNFRPAQVSGTKFNDLNQNGIRDSGEPGVAGVVIILDGTDGGGNPVNQPTATDADGNFFFIDLVPGVYTVTEVVPANWEPTTPTSSGPHGLISNQVLGLGDVFGNYLANLPPTAGPAEFPATGNVGINVAAPGVLTNATDPNSPPQPLSATVATGLVTSAGGEVDIAADGNFVYTPPAGHTGPDTFNYEVCDDVLACDTGLITINVADMIWFIDNSAGAGDGSLASPFNSIAAFEASGLPAANDCIFIEETGSDYSGPLTLANGQVLVGEGSTVPITDPAACNITMAPGSEPLPATGGTRPVINSAADGIVLALGNTIRGLNVGNTTGIGISGSSVGTATVSEASILGTGAALSISTGTLAMDFDEVSSTVTGTEGIFLSAVEGSLEIGSGAISATGDSAVDISGTGPGLALDATFTSLSSSGGGGPGINLANTIGTGGLTVTGVSPTAASGGTFANMPIGVNLSNAVNVSLSFMQMNDFTDFGIRGVTVAGFVLSDSVIESATTNGNNAAADEGSVRFTNLTGTVSFAGSRIEDGYEDNIRIDNNAGTLVMTVQDSATPNDMIIGHNATATGNDGILLETSSAAIATLTVSGVQFDGARGDMIQTNALGTSDQTVTIENSTFNNTHPNIVSGGGGITLSGGSATSNITVLYDVSDNVFTGALGNAITANYLSRQGTVTGTIDLNDIGTVTAGSGSAGGAGIAIGAEKQWSNPAVDTGDLVHTVVIDNNTIQSVNGDAGIDILSNRGFDTGNRAEINATISNNDISRMDGFALSALKLTVGGSAASGDFANLCTDISGNTLDASDPVDGNFAGNAVFYDQISTDARHNIPGYTGSANGEFNGGTASTDIDAHLNTDSNTLVNGSFPLYPGIGVDASTVLNVTNSGTSCP